MYNLSLTVIINLNNRCLPEFLFHSTVQSEQPLCDYSFYRTAETDGPHVIKVGGAVLPFGAHQVASIPLQERASLMDDTSSKVVYTLTLNL